MMNTIPEWATRYTGIPYETQNCWALVQAVYAGEFGIHLGAEHEQHDCLRDRFWLPQDIPIEGAVVLFNHSMDKHVGVVLNRDLMLHTVAGANSCIESFRSIVWKDRIVGIYRHADY